MGHGDPGLLAAPADWDASTVAEPASPITKCGDYSQHQASFISDVYPIAQLAFRGPIMAVDGRNPAEDQHRPPSGWASEMLAADLDGLGRHLAEILDHNTPAFSVRARIHAHVHR